jgi:formylglycine-generating enzyme required for sulfatase activity
MKKSFFPFIFLVLASQLLTAQQRRADNIFFCGYGNKKINHDVCNLVGRSSFASDHEAEEAVARILSPLGLVQNFALVNCPHIENAVAITPSNGMRYIIYDNQFMNRISGSSSDWAALSILSHEIGHHLLGHTLTGAIDLADSRKKELEADKFAGFQMYKMGASLSQAQQAVRLVANEYDDSYSTHPKLSRRLAAVEEGYRDACRQDPNCGNPTPPTPKPRPDLPDMVFVKGGTFQMGSDDGDDDEKPVHRVTLSDFYLHKNEVTVEEFSKFILATNYRTDAEKSDESFIWDSSSLRREAGVNWRNWDDRGKVRPSSEFNHPAVHVSWHDAVAYCNWRSEQDVLEKVYTISGSNVTANWDANGYRLPTEAEWEYAARSRGKNEKWAGTSNESGLSSYANVYGSSDGYQYTAPVGSFHSNNLGLYDMSGNVWEWCWDWKGAYPSSSQTNPNGSDSGSHRVYRGGSWRFHPADLRCANRSGYSPDYKSNVIGFRLARAAR